MNHIDQPRSAGTDRSEGREPELPLGRGWRTTLVHDPVRGDQVELFLRADHIHVIIHEVLVRAEEPADLADVIAVHACLDPYGMPEGVDGRPVWSVPPDPMWRLVQRVKDDVCGQWLREACAETERIFAAEMPDLIARGHQRREPA